MHYAEGLTQANAENGRATAASRLIAEYHSRHAAKLDRNVCV
jgi:hypothetical protein